MLGVRVLLLHPQWRRSCSDCLKWRYDEHGKPMERPHGSGNRLTNDDGYTPCTECPKIPEGSPKERRYAQELSDKNFRAWQHWRECKAVGRFPDDEIVKRNAAILQSIQDELDRQPIQQLTQLMMLSTKKA